LKKADNDFLKLKKEINVIDEKIYNNKKSIKKLEELNENFSFISKMLNKCCDIINSSIKNKTKNAIINDINNENKIRYFNTIYTSDKECEFIKKEIRKLNDEKENNFIKLKEELNKKDINDSNKG